MTIHQFNFDKRMGRVKPGIGPARSTHKIESPPFQAPESETPAPVPAPKLDPTPQKKSSMPASSGGDFEIEDVDLTFGINQNS